MSSDIGVCKPSICAVSFYAVRVATIRIAMTTLTLRHGTTVVAVIRLIIIVLTKSVIPIPAIRLALLRCFVAVDRWVVRLSIIRVSRVVRTKTVPSAHRVSIRRSVSRSSESTGLHHGWCRRVDIGRMPLSRVDLDTIFDPSFVASKGVTVGCEDTKVGQYRF